MTEKSKVEPMVNKLIEEILKDEELMKINSRINFLIVKKDDIIDSICHCHINKDFPTVKVGIVDFLKVEIEYQQKMYNEKFSKLVAIKKVFLNSE